MSRVVAWVLFALGIAHIVFGLVTFKAPLAEAASAGFVGEFNTPELRRTAFWFVLFGPLVMLAGHTAVHAVEAGDLALLRIVGIYAFITSIVGVVAAPKSPFGIVLVVSALLVAGGYGLLP